MNAAADRTEDNASGPVLYMALNLSNKRRRLIFGDGSKLLQVSRAAPGHKPPVEDLPDSCHSNVLSVLSLHILTGILDTFLINQTDTAERHALRFSTVRTPWVR